MKVGRPSYVKEFHCIGSACKDTCCAGWEIEIDETTYEAYKQVKGEFGKRLEKNIGLDQGEPYFKLAKGRRCSFLNDRNLCDIYIELGEDSLCDICREHPRFYEWFGNYMEMGIGLCCEEGERLLFASKEKIKFEWTKQDGEDEAEEDELVSGLFQARNTGFFLLQNRNYTIWQRLQYLLLYGEELQDALDRENIYLLPVLADKWSRSSFLEGLEPHKCVTLGERTIYYKSFLAVYKKLEILDTTWKTLLQDMDRQCEAYLKAENTFLQSYENRDFEYEHLAVYFLYRYFMQAVFQEDIITPVKFTAISVLMLHLADCRQFVASGTFTKTDRYDLARMYSKEIEYCPENMDSLAEEFWENPAFSWESILSVLRHT